MNGVLLAAAAVAIAAITVTAPVAATPMTPKATLDETFERLAVEAMAPIHQSFAAGMFQPLIGELKKKSLPDLLAILDDVGGALSAQTEGHGPEFVKGWANFRAGKLDASIPEFKAHAEEQANFAVSLFDGTAEPAPPTMTPVEVQFERLTTFALAPIYASFAAGLYESLVVALKKVDAAAIVACARQAAQGWALLPDAMRANSAMAHTWADFRAGKFDAYLAKAMKKGELPNML